MVETIYIEREVADHPRTAQLLRRFPRAAQIPCERYGEVFNRRQQSFRLQKRRPALILARKHDRHVLPAPAGYAVGSDRNFYFSHLLNCLYDCRYCFLQGMFRSAHYVLFVNYEAFASRIEQLALERPGSWFFSGYDGDSLALDRLTGFVDSFVPLFSRLPRAWLELRTKSVNIKPLLAHRPLSNVVVAFSFTPREISEAHEHGVPPLSSRIAALQRVARAGWPVGLRFDPVIYHPDYEQQYRALFDATLGAVSAAALHSVSLGPFRLPRDYYRTMQRLYPDEPLLSGPLQTGGSMVAYPRALERRMLDFCLGQLRRSVPADKLFPCEFRAEQDGRQVERDASTSARCAAGR